MSAVSMLFLFSLFLTINTFCLYPPPIELIRFVLTVGFSFIVKKEAASNLALSYASIQWISRTWVIEATVFLAETAKRVYLLVRSAGLTESMSRYLIPRIEGTATIVFHPYKEIVALEEGNHLESVRWRNSQRGRLRSTR
jgi:hypothetical protein